MRRTSGEGRPRPISACWRTSKTTSKNHPFATSFNGVHRESSSPRLAHLSRPPRSEPTKGGLSRRLSYSSRPIPVDSFQFRIYRDLSPPPSSTTRRLLSAPRIRPRGRGPMRTEPERVRSTEFRCVLSCRLPHPSLSLSLSPSPLLSLLIICITSNLET